ncbi:MAG: hypothetical protein HY235_03785 [Acidobacteria bacterium]|nr:hypothetical protein [Acidobacteriota bacterium]
MKKRGKEPMREALYRMSGVDLTTIDAIGVETVQVVLSEYGPDLSRFPRNGGDVAVFATARKLAVLIYRLIRWGQPYVDEGAEAYENRYRENRIRTMTAKAKEFGFRLVPADVRPPAEVTG